MQIDVHAYIGQYGKRRIEPDAVSAYAEQCGLDCVFVSNLGGASLGEGAENLDEVDANTAVLTAVRTRPRLRPLYWVRPGRFDSNLYAFAGAMEVEGFLGAVFAPLLNGFRADDALLDPYLNILSRLKKVALFRTARQDQARPSRVYEIARRHPRLAFVLCNAASDTHWREALDCVDRARHRDDARLYIETSHTAVREVMDAVKAAGNQRVLFGSGVLEDAQQHSREVSELLASLRGKLRAETFARISGCNTADLFRVEQPVG
jgi:predicted TIM-barrel fold metal-dependent hydrolase